MDSIYIFRKQLRRRSK